METLQLVGAFFISLLSLTLQPPFPPPPPFPPLLISVASKTKKCWKLKQSTLKGGEGKGRGKGLNSRYGGHWKLEKVFFSESVSTILQLAVACILSFNIVALEPLGRRKEIYGLPGGKRGLNYAGTFFVDLSVMQLAKPCDT